MAETATKPAKSLIPRRIRNKIDAAFDSQMIYAEAGKSPDEIKKAHKKIAGDKKEVLAFIEDLLADTVD